MTGLAEKTVEIYEALEKERLSIEYKYSCILSENLKLGHLVSYVGNKNIPILRLYRFKEAFSLGLVNCLLDRFQASSRDFVFDPFTGMGTCLFAAMIRNIPSAGVEKLPVAGFIAETLPLFLSIEPGSIIATFDKIKPTVDCFEPAIIADDVSIMKIAFDQPTLERLRKWKSAIDSLASPMKEIFIFLFLSILESTSYTANDGQFLRLKPDKKTINPDDALLKKILQAENDLLAIQNTWHGQFCEFVKPQVFSADTRNLADIRLQQEPTILITSPPYPNRYDYSRSYCLELCFNFVRNFQELKAIRFGMLRSHIESKTQPDDKPPHPVIAEVLENLQYKHLNNPRIPIMLLSYFVDMNKVIREWSRVLAPGARVAVVVDNVRFAGQLIPVDLVLSDLADNHGFVVENIIIARYKGNSSQQMGRYGRVPVRESIVIWRKL